MDWFYWIIMGGPEMILSAIFFAFILPIGIITSIVSVIRDSRRQRRQEREFIRRALDEQQRTD